MKPVDVNVDDIVYKLITNRQLFLTGAGGTGKTYSLNLIKSRFRNVLLTGTTHMAATLINGVTINSLLRLGIAKDENSLKANDKRWADWFCNNVTDDRALAYATLHKKIREVVSKADLLVIDEVSMMSAQLLDLIYLRFNQINIIPPPILFIGDLFQLPPVSKEQKVDMIFKSQHWKPIIVELTRIRRTANREFAEAQKHIRIGKYTEKVYNLINQIHGNVFPQSFNPTYLVSTNKLADKINRAKLEAINSPEVVIPAKIETTLKGKELETAINSLPAEQELILKVGADIVFISNDYEEELYYNGLRGTIKELPTTLEYILVETEKGNVIKVLPQTFTKNKIVLLDNDEISYEPELDMTQFPVKLSYAVTIHKSQGMSLSEIHIDCSNMFAPGQFYVALSRGTNPNLVRIKNFNPRVVRIDNSSVIDYFKEAEMIKVDNLLDSAPKVLL